MSNKPLPLHPAAADSVLYISLLASLWFSSHYINTSEWSCWLWALHLDSNLSAVAPCFKWNWSWTLMGFFYNARIGQNKIQTLVTHFNLIYRVSQEECARLREGVPYVKVYRYNPKRLCPKLNSYGDGGQRSLKLWQLLHTYWLPNTY